MTEPKAKDSTQKMQTLSECINQAQQDGYSENFKIGTNLLLSENGDLIYPPDHVTIKNFYRFEGYSDPADSSILYLLETSDGKKGLLVDAYDTYADASVAKFIKQVEEIQKRPPESSLEGNSKS